jgi:hypothetical protein
MTEAAGIVLEETGAAPRRTGVPPRVWTRRFYVAIALLLFAMVLVGFWPTYFGTFLGERMARPWVMDLHGAVFTGWMVLLLAQVTLVATGRVRIHRVLGAVGIAYAALVLFLGLIVSFVAPAAHVRGGAWTMDTAAGFLLLPLVDMVLFAAFVGAAIAYRRRVEIHKRLMLATTVVLVFPAVARMPFESPVVIFFVWLAPLFAAMAFDLLTQRRVHPVHYISVTVLAVAFLRVGLMESESWLRIGRVLLRPFV